MQLDAHQIAVIDLAGLAVNACGVGITSAAIALVSPRVEVWATELPPKRMGVFGIMMVVLGSLVQSVPYWGSAF